MTQATPELWQSYVDGGPLPEGLPEEVAASWDRCRAAGVDPRVATLPQLPPADVEARIEAASALLDFISPSLDGLAKHLLESGILVCVVDRHGCVLKLWGQAREEDSELANHTVPGLVLREVLSGTTALAICKRTQRVATCVGHEHYCVQMHDLSEAAFPVRGESADWLGTLLLWGKADRDSEASLKLLGRSCLRQAAIERRARRVRQSIERHAHILGRLMSTSSKPVVLVGPKGYVRMISPAAARLLQIDLTANLNRPIDQIARFDPAVLPRLCVGRDIHDVSLDVHTGGRSFRVTADAIALRDGSGGSLGTMLLLEERAALKTRRRDARQGARFTFQDIRGQSEAVTRHKEMARISARTSVSVLLEGASGTGKELFAQAIHNESDRSEGPFVSINCAAIPAELIESELFGYEEGAFTGARPGGMAGKFEAASGGTIFLDEIGDMPLTVQAECLRVLENRTVTRVGQHEEVPVDIRVIAATNKRLLEEVETGRFREDLYYRLSVFRISLPALRECASDIPDLVEGFVDRYNNEMSRSVAGLAEGVLERFMTYEWPGNVRELKNAIEHAVMVDTDNLIGFDDLQEELRDKLLSQSEDIVVDAKDPLVDQKKGIEKLERDLQAGARDLYIRALKETGGNVKEAAKTLKVSRATFYRKMREFDLSRTSIMQDSAEG